MLKKFLILSVLLLSASVYAAEQPQQDIQNEQSYATFNIQKQPEKGKQKQGINNRFTFFTINIQINGKIKDNPDDNNR